MDSTPPPPPQPPSSAAASGSYASSHSSPPRGGSMITAAALTGAHHSQSQRRSLYPPPLPSRNAAAAASCTGGSSSSRSWSRYPGGSNRSQTAMLYEELCAIRSTSAHFLSRVDAIVDDQRKQQPLHQQPPAAQPFSPAAGAGSSFSSQQHLARPSSSMSGRLDLLTRNGNISAGSFSPGSTTTTSPHLRGGGSLSSLAYASSPSLSQPQELAALFSSTKTIPGLPGSFFSSSSSTTSGLPDLPGGSIFGNAPPQLQNQGHGSVFSFAAFAQASSQPPLLSHHLQRQQPWNLLPGPSSSSSSWSPSSSDNNVVPSSWACGNTATSGTTNSGFVMQPPLSDVSSPSEQHGDELPPLPPSLQLQPPLLLPVKQEPSSSNNSSLDPELIYIDSDDEPFDLDTLMTSLESSPALMASLLGSNPGLKSMRSFGSASSSGDMQFQMGGANGDELMTMSSSWGAQTWSSPVPEDVVNGIGMMSIDGGNSSACPPRFGSMAWTGQMSSSMPSMQQQLPWQQGGTLASSSSDLSQQFMQPAGFELPPLPPSMDMGNSTSSATHVMQYGNSIGPITWNAGNDRNRGAMKGPAVNCDAISGSNNSKLSWQQSHSSSTGRSSVAIPKLRLGGMESRRVPPPSSPSSATAASSSMSRSGANGNLFTDVEMERLMKDKRLKELVNTDPNRVKRILRNRVSASKAKAKKKNGLQDLERQFEALQAENVMLASQLLSEQTNVFKLKNQNNGLRLRLQQLEVQAKMGQDESEALQSEIESLKLAELSGLY